MGRLTALSLPLQLVFPDIWLTISLTLYPLSTSNENVMKCHTFCLNDLSSMECHVKGIGRRWFWISFICNLRDFMIFWKQLELKYRHRWLFVLILFSLSIEFIIWHSTITSASMIFLLWSVMLMELASYGVEIFFKLHKFYDHLKITVTKTQTSMIIFAYIIFSFNWIYYVTWYHTFSLNDLSSTESC